MRLFPCQLVTAVIWAASGVAMLVVGLGNLKNCPVDETIPVRLIAFGVLSLFGFCVMLVAVIAKHMRDDSDSKSRIEKFSGYVFLFAFKLNLALMIWMSFRVFQVYQPAYINCVDESEPGCGPTSCGQFVYLTAFVLSIVAYIPVVASVFALSFWLFKKLSG